MKEEEYRSEINRLLLENAELRDTIGALTEEAESLLLHSTVYAYGSPGIVVDPDLAKISTCRCYNEKICFQKGVIGALSKSQREACPSVENLESPAMTRRLENWMAAVDVCKVEIGKIPKGERLEPWLSCMGRELPKRGIEI